MESEHRSGAGAVPDPAAGPESRPAAEKAARAQAPAPSASAQRKAARRRADQRKPEHGKTEVRSSIARLERQVEALVRTVAIPADLRSASAAFSGRRFGLNSQFGEDGILLALHEAIGAESRRFVELGCGDNGGNSGTLATELGWHGLMVDADAAAVATVARLSPTITGAADWISAENVNDVIESNGFAGEIDQLSIDLDGNDYWILKALTVCRPRLLIMEYNSAFGPDSTITVPYDEQFQRSPTQPHGALFFGASLGALTRLAGERGYGLVAVEPTGANAFFLADGLGPQIPRREPQELYRTLPKHRAAVANPRLLEQMAEAGLHLIDVGPNAPQPRQRGRTGRPSLGRASRESFFDAAAKREIPLIGLETAWGSYVVSTSDLGVGRSLFVTRKRGEMKHLETAISALRRQDVSLDGAFVDCGANIGTSVIPALRDGPFTTAICFEPNPANHRLLKANLALNDLDDRTTALRAAVSRTSGVLEMAVHPTNFGAHEIMVVDAGPSPEMPPGDQEIIEVSVVTIDETLAELSLTPGDVGMLWLDVQGHEAAALEGASGLLKAAPPAVLEFYPEMLDRAGGLSTFLDTMEEVYTSVLDLRSVPGPDAEPAWRPVQKLRRIAEERRLTDILLARL